uniref:Putative ovule protein n=2 Tax=Solanum chacoense TaxID=4108 RepID=A0A0V0H607_SOLCH
MEGKVTSEDFYALVDQGDERKPRLRCANSSLLMPNLCRILQKYPTFGESDMHLLTFLKSPKHYRTWGNKGQTTRSFVFIRGAAFPLPPISFGRSLNCLVS